MLRKPERILVAAVAELALLGAPVWAAEEGGEEANLFGGDLVISICTLLIFVLVLVVLAKVAWGPLLAALQSREKYIRESLASAKRDRESAERTLREYEDKLREAREEASAMVEEGRRDAEVVRRKIEEDARASAEAIAERAKREIGIARDTALRELHEQSAQLAMTMASAVLKRQLSPEDHRKLVEDALDELGERPISKN
jgi:F-type H+-transporting ATPase subunit b